MQMYIVLDFIRFQNILIIPILNGIQQSSKRACFRRLADRNESMAGTGMKLPSLNVRQLAICIATATYSHPTDRIVAYSPPSMLYDQHAQFGVHIVVCVCAYISLKRNRSLTEQV